MHVYQSPLKSGPYRFEKKASYLHNPSFSIKDHEDTSGTDTLRAAANHTRDFFGFRSITVVALLLRASICNSRRLFSFLGLCLLIGWEINVRTLLLHLVNLRKLRNLRHLWPNSRKAELQSKHVPYQGLALHSVPNVTTGMAGHTRESLPCVKDCAELF